jgi:UDP:flavonoid glycosyltransferase YjiC (YdhE family)
MPSNGAAGEKHIDVVDFSAKVNRVLNEPGYRNSALRIVESMRQYGGARQAADRIERFAEDLPA